MEQVDTLVCARWVLPVEPDGAVLTDHAVAIRAGRIVAVLPTDEAKPRYAAEQLVERPHHALLPGFVNAHTHAAMVLLRGRGENASLGPWLREAIWPIERRWVDPEYVRDGTELAIAEMLRAGVTCFGDMHLWPEIVARTAAELHVRASVGLVVVDAATRWASGPDEYIEKGMALRDEY
ncbi:MAG TPA: amidohydrolase family protein, partial [Steroidobacteraceae bacterium]|nr:amidohydrolase family protein [Steroidobacteraceae bacterium]